MHQWKGLHENCSMETQKFEKFPKNFEILILTCDEELKSPQFRQHQSCISNWYINGKVFTSTTASRPKNLIFLSSKFEFWLVFWLELKSWNHLSLIKISPTSEIGASIERSSRVLLHGNPKIWTVFKKVRNSNFDLRRRAKITLVSSISVLH